MSHIGKESNDAQEDKEAKEEKEQDLVFQALSWHAQDVWVEEEVEEGSDYTLLESKSLRYTIKIFGRDAHGKTVSLTVTDFPPYFYLKVPDTWSMMEKDFLQRYVNDTLRRNAATRKESVKVRYIQKKDFWGFTNERPCKFLRLDFVSLRGFRTATKLFEAPKVKIPHLSAACRLQLYESNIDPYIRMLHLRGLEPCGWIRVPASRVQDNELEEMDTHCDRDLQTQWNFLEDASATMQESARFVVASFDIECMSDTGDFPVPQRDYRKLSFELVQAYAKLWKGLNEYDCKKRIVTCIQYAIGLQTTLGCIPLPPTHPDLAADAPGQSQITETITRYTLKPSSSSSQDNEAAALQQRIEMYVDDLYRVLKDGFKPKRPATLAGASAGASVSTSSVSTSSVSTSSVSASVNQEKIATQINQLLSSKKHLNLPALEGDAVIQIGTTFHRYGERECFFKHIVTLGTCDPFEGAVVESCATERELLMAWQRLMAQMNPDIVIGYNIFGFDFAYMVARARELGCEEEFLKVGRFKHRTCDFLKKRLSSSALGDNFLEYIDMHGRVLIDIMKVVQRDHKLDSYKLDHVASTFMKQNKHDVSPQDIFRLQRGTSADRSVIAQYCVQDCALCNHLTMKLEIIANNIGMANVCLVPLSFIFMRGQGIKIFSLVLKQCKDDGFLIPVIQRPNLSLLEIRFEPAADEDACTESAIDFFKDMTRQSAAIGSSGASASGGEASASSGKITSGRRFGAAAIPIAFDQIKMFRAWRGTGGSSLVCLASSPQNLFDLNKRLANYMESMGHTCEVTAKPASVSDFKIAVEEDILKQMPKRGMFRWTCVYAFEDEDPDADGAEGQEPDGYEGAIVLDPQEGIYTEDPISVLDYASLYPSSMISENLSHDCLVLDPRYDNLPGVTYENITYDIYAGTGDKKQKIGEKVCRFVQHPDGRKGVLPTILTKLLKARKTTRKKMELQQVTIRATGEKHVGWYDEATQKLVPQEGPVIDLSSYSDQADQAYQAIDVEDYYSSFQKAVLDGLQLAYKVTANSLYGQMGARTSPLYLKDVAACTTATGRKMILKAKAFIETHFPAEIVYGDTDSIFVKFKNTRVDPVTGETHVLKGKEAILTSIESAIAASKAFKKHLKPPHDLEYEKTFWPFILLSKKRYVGNLYEFNDTKYKQKSMGIVLKRRDNAPIVKRVYGGIIDIILSKQDVQQSAAFLKDCLQELIEGRCPMEDLVVSKSLRADYKDPDRIAHKVLADRMGERDPGNKPQVNERIPYVYIVPPAPPPGSATASGRKTVLQGDRIEHPTYIQQKKLTPDYGFYITNQIMKPVLQLFAIVVEKLPGYKKPPRYFEELVRKPPLSESLGQDPKKIKDKIDQLREQEAKAILFDPYLISIENKRQGNREITTWFKPVPKPAAAATATASGISLTLDV